MQYKRKLAKGDKWWYKFDFQGKTFFSKAIYQTKGEAKKGEAERLANLEKELAIVPMTFFDLCQKRLDSLKASKTEAYYKSNRLILKPIVAKFGNRQVRDITRAEISAYLENMATDLKKRGKDMYLINLNIRMLKALFFYAQDELEIIDKNPVKGIKAYPVRKKLKYIPPDSDLDFLKTCFKGERRRFFIFIMETGARASEALRATADDLRENGVILWTKKSKNGDLVPRLVTTTALNDLIWPASGRLFSSWCEYPRWLEDTLRAAKMKAFGFHALRHRYASKLCAEGKSLVEIRDLLGHSSVQTTNIYLQQLGLSAK